nr:EAL domain-containing protein [Rhizobium sp. P28RR-XV]
MTACSRTTSCAACNVSCERCLKLQSSILSAAKLRLIEELRTEGLLVALDDFGTGYASQTHLLEFPVDIIKIDKSFVDRISDDRGETIVKALLDMAAGLGVRMVAEGVETTNQASDLARLGCPFAQGFLFGRAADRDKITELLQAGMVPVPPMVS